MPKSKEYVSSEESNSSEDEKPQKKKVKAEEKKSKSEKSEKSKSSSASNKSNNDEETIWDLGNMREVKVREFKGKWYVDIREMYLDKDTGESKPGRKGISLSITQFKKLVDCIHDVDKVVQEKV